MVVLKEFCIPNDVRKTTVFVPAQLEYTINDPIKQVSTFDPTWTTKPNKCDIKYVFTVVEPATTPVDPALFTFVDNQFVSPPSMRVEVHTNTIFHSGGYLNGFYTPGVYKVEVRAFTENDVDTGEFEELEITVIDPCLTATLTIDDSVHLPDPAISLTTFVGYEPHPLQWTDSVVTSTITDPNLCGPYAFELSDADTGQTLAPNVFPTADL